MGPDVESPELFEPLACAIDTETTGLKEPVACEIAIKVLGTKPVSQPQWRDQLTLHHDLFNPGKPISYGAMAVHHITNEMVSRCMPTSSFTLPRNVQYLVGHNVDFDWEAIGKPNVKRIDTLALARWLYPEEESHTLGALMYMLNPGVMAKAKGMTHSAAVDCQLCVTLLELLMALHPDVMRADTWEQLWLKSEHARVPVYMDFGKYDGRNGERLRCDEVWRRDPGYYSWLMRSCDQVTENPYLRKALEAGFGKRQ